MATITIPVILANFESSLAASISAAASSLTLNTSVDDDGSTLSGTYSLTIDEGSSSEEHMVVTLAGAAGTITRRGLSRVDGWTEQAGNQLAHDRGASVKITNFSLLNLSRLLNGDDAFNSVDWTGVQSIDGLSTPGAAETTKAADVAYVNAVAVAGANDAAENQKGIVELATSAELLAGTDQGSTSAYLFARPSHLAANVQNQVYSYVADTGAADAYVITIVPAVTAYAAGQRFTFLSSAANTGASTLNVNALGAKNILKFNDQALEANDIESGSIVEVVYDGTSFQLQTPLASSLTTAIASEVSTFFGATDISGAEAETLTDGSDASQLHEHAFASGVITRGMTAATGSVNTAHGLGVTPKRIKITATFANANHSHNSFGTYDGSSYATVYVQDGTAAQSSTSEVVFIRTASGHQQVATAALDGTNITLSWTKTGTPTGNAYLLWEAFA